MPRADNNLRIAGHDLANLSTRNCKSKYISHDMAIGNETNECK